MLRRLPDEGVDLLDALPYAADRLRVVARVGGRFGGQCEKGYGLVRANPECVHHEEGLENLLPGFPAHECFAFPGTAPLTSGVAG